MKQGVFIGVLILVAISILIAGCKVKEEKPVSVDAEIQDVESSVENVSQVEEEINVSELEELDEALAEIEW